MDFIQKLIITIILALLPYVSFAQCAMCKASATDSPIAKSLNKGILYLLLFPFLIIVGGGILWYKNRKKFSVTDWDDQI